MSNISSLYKRFGIEPSITEAERIFKSQCCKIIDANILDSYLDRIVPKIGFHLGIDTERRRGLGEFDQPAHDYSKIFNRSLPLNEFMLRLQMAFNFLWDEKPKISDGFADTISIYLKKTQSNLNYKIVHRKTRAPQIYSTTTPFLDDNLIIQVLGILDDGPDKYKHIIDNFEEGMKELLSAGSNQLKLKNVCEDMLNTCDEAAKVISGDKNAGLAQLLKNKDLLPLNHQQKNIYSAMRESLDMIKHGTLKEYSRKDVEELVYLTAALIKRLFG